MEVEGLWLRSGGEVGITKDKRVLCSPGVPRRKDMKSTYMVVGGARGP